MWWWSWKDCKKSKLELHLQEFRCLVEEPMFTDNDNKKTDLEKEFDEVGNVSDTALVTPTEIRK